MNIKRYIGATIALFVFIIMWEVLVHGILLLGIYEATASVWRSFEVMKANLPLELGFQFVLSAWTAFIFTRFYKDGGLVNGVSFGFYIGILGGILTATWYLWLPVPAVLGIIWFMNGVLEGIGAGIVVGLIYHR